MKWWLEKKTKSFYQVSPGVLAVILRHAAVFLGTIEGPHVQQCAFAAHRYSSAAPSSQDKACQAGWQSQKQPQNSNEGAWSKRRACLRHVKTEKKGVLSKLQQQK